MNVMLDLIDIGIAEQWEAGSKQNIQNENISLHRESNQQPLLSDLVL